MSDGGATLRWNGDAFLRHAMHEAEAALAKSGEVIRNQMKRNLSGASPSAPGGYPGTDTGTLKRSIYNERAAPMVRQIGTRVPYGKWLETGVTIRAKNVKALPVPLNRKARRMLRTLNLANGARGSLRQRNLAPVKMGGKMFLVERTAGGKPSRSADAARFVLRKSVRIAPRPWCFRSAAQAQGEALAVFQREMEAGIARAAAKAGGSA